MVDAPAWKAGGRRTRADLVVQAHSFPLWRRSEAGEHLVPKTGVPQGIVGSAPTVSATHCPVAELVKAVAFEAATTLGSNPGGAALTVGSSIVLQKRQDYALNTRLLDALLAHRIERSPVKAENQVQFLVRALPDAPAIMNRGGSRKSAPIASQCHDSGRRPRSASATR